MLCSIAVLFTLYTLVKLPITSRQSPPMYAVQVYAGTGGTENPGWRWRGGRCAEATEKTMAMRRATQCSARGACKPLSRISNYPEGGGTGILTHEY